MFTSVLVLAAHNAAADETTAADQVGSQSGQSSQSQQLSSQPSSSSSFQSAVASSFPTLSLSTSLSSRTAPASPILQTGFGQGAAGTMQGVQGTVPSGTQSMSQNPADATADNAAMSADASADAPRGSFLAGVASKAGDVVVGALNLIGVRYRWGGNSPDSGLDCSGFVRYVFQDTLNFTLPRRAEEMSRVGEKVKFSDLKPGDLVFFNTVRRTISHVGIYIGHDKFVHSPSTGSTIRVDEMNDRYWETRYRGARRVSLNGSDDDGTDIATRLKQAANLSY